ncbi:MAG: sulfite exporter TauE/SafE family protein [Rhizobiales bacterium]|nr:sulfite exporter TauE/SafE family protein [Hyphomicrobiales bacterium]
MSLFWLPEFPTTILALLAATAFLAGLSRGFSGFGAALIFVPLASSLIGPKLATPILAVIDLIFAAHLIPRAWTIGDRREVAVMFLGALFGIPAGTMILRNFDPLTLRWMIAGMATAMFLLILSGWRYHGKPHPSATVAVGAVSGLFGGIAQIGGPPVVSYWLGTGREPARLRANIILFFAASGLFSFISYWWGGLLSEAVVKLSIVAGPGYGIGTYLGTHIFGLASPSTFRVASLVLIALAVVTSLPIFG